MPNVAFSKLLPCQHMGLHSAHAFVSNFFLSAFWRYATVYTIVFREGRTATGKSHLREQGKITGEVDVIVAVRCVLDSSPCFLPGKS